MQADPAVTLPGADKTARDLAEMYGHAAVLEVLDEYQEQVSCVIFAVFACKLAPGLAEMYGDTAVLEVLDEYQEQVQCHSYASCILQFLLANWLVTWPRCAATPQCWTNGNQEQVRPAGNVLVCLQDGACLC